MSKPLKLPKNGMIKPKEVKQKKGLPVDPNFVTADDIAAWCPKSSW